MRRSGYLATLAGERPARGSMLLSPPRRLFAPEPTLDEPVARGRDANEPLRTAPAPAPVPGADVEPSPARPPAPATRRAITGPSLPSASRPSPVRHDRDDPARPPLEEQPLDRLDRLAAREPARATMARQAPASPPPAPRIDRLRPRPASTGTSELRDEPRARPPQPRGPRDAASATSSAGTLSPPARARRALQAAVPGAPPPEPPVRQVGPRTRGQVGPGHAPQVHIGTIEVTVVPPPPGPQPHPAGPVPARAVPRPLLGPAHPEPWFGLAQR